MRLSVDNGTVVLSLENKNRAFMSEISGYFKGWLHGKLKMEEASESGILYAQMMWWWLDGIVKLAAIYNIEVDASVYDRLQDFAEQGGVTGDKNSRKENGKPAEPTKWQQVCQNGCGTCRYKRRDGDDYVCAASGDILPEQNKPGYRGIIYQLFNYVPFPSENCIYNKKLLRSN